MMAPAQRVHEMRALEEKRRALQAQIDGMTKQRAAGVSSVARWAKDAPPCRFFLAGRCMHGAQCAFSHALEAADARAARAKAGSSAALSAPSRDEGSKRARDWEGVEPSEMESDDCDDGEEEGEDESESDDEAGDVGIVLSNGATSAGEMANYERGGDYRRASIPRCVPRRLPSTLRAHAYLQQTLHIHSRRLDAAVLAVMDRKKMWIAKRLKQAPRHLVPISRNQERLCCCRRHVAGSP